MAVFGELAELGYKLLIDSPGHWTRVLKLKWYRWTINKGVGCWCSLTNFVNVFSQVCLDTLSFI